MYYYFVLCHKFEIQFNSSSEKNKVKKTKYPRQIVQFCVSDLLFIKHFFVIVNLDKIFGVIFCPETADHL